MTIETVQDGVVVSIEYTLHVNGELLDSSEGQGPLQFLAGYGNIVPGLEEKMIGMKIGESKKVEVSPEEGYGEYDEEALMDVPLDQFPKEMQVTEGAELTVRDDDGHAQLATVEKVEGETVTLNFNHPLAGETLNFYVRVVALREPNAEELEHGHVHEPGHHH